MAQGRTRSPVATRPQGHGAGLQELLRQASGVSEVQSAASATVFATRIQSNSSSTSPMGAFSCPLGWMRLRLSRPVPGELRNATVSFKAGKWCVSIQTEREVEQPVPHATSAIGIDVGIARFATMSDGTFVAPLNSFKKHEARLRRCQRAMSRKVKFSNNWKSHDQSPAHPCAHRQCSPRLPAQGHDHDQQNHAMVCIEDLQVRNMSRSAAGSIDAPGRNVRAKSGLNKAILDQGGSSSGGSWNTSWPGMAAGWWRCRPRIQAVRARLVDT